MAIEHRGPDDAGEWCNPAAGIALANRRLAVVDLSPEGHQPMCTPSARYTIAYNGEVYNFVLLRKELEGLGRSFRGGSDTEVILAAIEQWGMEAAVSKFIGMFAFAVWDDQEKELSIVRDRIGIKPVFVYDDGKAVIFASELKAIREHPAFERNLNLDVLPSYLRYRYVPAPEAIFRNVRKLRPGTIARFRDGGRTSRETVYWSVQRIATEASKYRATASVEDLEAELRVLLLDAVSIHSIADVPVGAFLSGGVDSSTITALMQVQSRRRVKTFSIGFHDREYDESGYAASVARHLGTEHTALRLTSEDVLAVIPEMGFIFDEPFADPSQIPTLLVSRLARQQVTVALSGDGGDELFGGYTRYAWVPRLFGRRNGLLRAMQRPLGAIPPAVLNDVGRAGRRFIPKSLRVGLLGDKVHKFAAADLTSPDHFYRSVASSHPSPEVLLAHHDGQPDPLLALLRTISLEHPIDRMTLSDMLTYLPDDILTKVDRASMACSLESRVPFLDHRVIEFSWRIPHAAKIHNGVGKWLLRRILHQYVPAQLTERHKTGFDLPIDQWLRGPLREWATQLIEPDRLKREGIFDPLEVARLFHEHLSGQRNWRDVLWAVLMFQVWSERWL